MLSFTIQKLGDVTLFRCEGRITADDGDHLRNAFLSQPHMRTAVLDLAGITTVDAAGLGALVFLLQRANAADRQLNLMNLRPRVAELFELTNLTPAFKVRSVSDMLELMCRATEQPRLAAQGTEGDRSGTTQDRHYWHDDRQSSAA